MAKLNKHTSVYRRLQNSPGENSDNETRCYRHLSTVRRINLSFITVETPHGDVKSNSYVLLDARSKETQWILCSAPSPPTLHKTINPLNDELNPLCYLLGLLTHHFHHVSRIWVKSLTLRLLMSYIYIYGAHILDVSRSHTTTQHSW